MWINIREEISALEGEEWKEAKLGTKETISEEVREKEERLKERESQGESGEKVRKSCRSRQEEFKKSSQEEVKKLRQEKLRKSTQSRRGASIQCPRILC